MKDRIEVASKKILNVLKRFGLKIDYNIYFPAYGDKKPLPDEVQLAIKTLVNHGMKVVFVLKDPSEPVKLDTIGSK